RSSAGDNPWMLFNSVLAQVMTGLWTGPALRRRGAHEKCSRYHAARFDFDGVSDSVMGSRRLQLAFGEGSAFIGYLQYFMLTGWVCARYLGKRIGGPSDLMKPHSHMLSASSAGSTLGALLTGAFATNAIRMLDRKGVGDRKDTDDLIWRCLDRRPDGSGQGSAVS
ncbi:MAG: hypothetical protein ABIZ80_08710, partial [Bryobacteraceae bacterium]